MVTSWIDCVQYYKKLLQKNKGNFQNTKNQAILTVIGVLFLYIKRLGDILFTSRFATVSKSISVEIKLPAYKLKSRKTQLQKLLNAFYKN